MLWMTFICKSVINILFSKKTIRSRNVVSFLVKLIGKFKIVSMNRDKKYAISVSKDNLLTRIEPKYMCYCSDVVIKGARKLYFMYRFRVVIILFSPGLYKSAFSTYSLVNLVFRLFVF